VIRARGRAVTKIDKKLNVFEIESIAVCNSIKGYQLSALNRPNFDEWFAARRLDPEQAELLDIIDSSVLSAIKVMKQVEPVLHPSILSDAHRIAQLFVDMPELIDVVRVNREHRLLKQPIKAFSKVEIITKCGHVLNEDQYSLFLALFTHQEGGRAQCPIWIAGTIVDIHNWIFDCFSNGISILEINNGYENIIRTVLAPLKDLLDFEIREIERVDAGRANASKGAKKSRSPRSGIQQAVEDILEDESRLKILSQVATKKYEKILYWLSEDGTIEARDSEGPIVLFTTGESVKFTSFRNTVTRVMKKK